VARINGLIPDSDGSLTVAVTKGTGAAQGLLNAMMLETYASDTLVAPDRLMALAGDENVTLHWTDRSNSEQQFRILRSLELEGSYDSVGSVGANITSFVDNGVAADIRYFYKVVAVGNDGQMMASEVASVTMPQLSVYVNFNLSEAPASFPWNNTQLPPVSGDTYGPFFNSKGDNSGITLDMISNFRGENTVGVNTGNNSGIYPDVVTESAYYLDHASDTVVMKVSNLNMAVKYDFTFFGSIVGYGWRNTTQYIANGQIVALETSYNKNNTVSLLNLSPDQNGQITIKVVYTQSSSFAILNAMIIRAHDNYDDDGNRIVDSALYMRTGKDYSQIITSDMTKSEDIASGSFRVIGNAYPNPFRQFVHIKFFSSRDDRINLSLYSMNGKLIDQKVETLSKGISLIFYQPSVDLAPGIYILSLKSTTGNKVINLKLIKQ